MHFGTEKKKTIGTMLPWRDKVALQLKIPKSLYTTLQGDGADNNFVSSPLHIISYAHQISGTDRLARALRKVFKKTPDLFVPTSIFLRLINL